jgi:hypothetical protein
VRALMRRLGLGVPAGGVLLHHATASDSELGDADDEDAHGGGGLMSDSVSASDSEDDGDGVGWHAAAGEAAADAA